MSLAKALFISRKQRSSFFKTSMFGEPAWDMLLGLFITEGTQRRQTIGGLAELAGAPMSTSLRWIDYLEQAKLIARASSPTDKRIVFIELTDIAREALHNYFSSVSLAI